MAILEHETIESNSGFAKELEESALTMIFDNLQKSQYHYPVKSTVREIACNALDSHKERDAVKEILSGKKKEEDYFIRRDEAIYKDSNFNKDYYDPKWLSNESHILITYNSVPVTQGSDFISIKDWGVGLGDKRLEGYMRLGFSTKRNSKLNIGKYGIGAKAPLSTNVESYRMITTYNGKKFIFDIYSHKVDSAIPKLNMETGKVNKGYTFANGFTAFYEETTEKNSSEVIVKTKKHHKSQYIDAVKSQLLYLPGVKFVVNEDGYESEQTVKSPILYEDDKIILAENYQYSRPHMVIDGVTYGYIDFLELELENKVGNVGIKVAPEEVTVTPSRETVVWNEQTRETVVNRFNEVVDIASNFVEKELQENNFVKWIQKCTSTLAHTNRNSTLGRLSTLIDKSQIKPAFPGNKLIKYKPVDKFFNGFRVRNIVKQYDGKKRMDRVQRTEVTSWSDLNFDNFYIQKEKTSHHKDLYIYHLANPSDDKYSRNTIMVVEPLELPVDHKLNPKQVKAYKDYRDLILKELKKAKVDNYEEVEIPSDWKDKLSKMEEAEKEGDSYDAPTMSPAERRKLNKATVYKKPYTSTWSNKVTLSIEEWTLKEVQNFDVDPTYDRLVYGTSEDRDLIEFLAQFLSKTNYQEKLKIISVAKDNIKLYKDLKKSVYIKDMFKAVDPVAKTVKVDKILVAYNTARLLSEEVEKLKFLKNFDSIDLEVSDKFKEVDRYIDNNHYTASYTIREQLDQFLGKLTLFQLFVKDVDGNEKMIAKKSEELFGTPDITDTFAVDMDIYEKYKDLLSYAEPVSILLNEVSALQTNRTLSEDLEREIKNYIKFKMDLK